MKKLFVLIMTIALLSTCLYASAYTPTDGDFQNTWGLPGAEVENATSAGVPLKWIKADGGDWPTRLSYATPVKLDGLTIKLKNVTIDQNEGSLAVGFFGDVGQWVDSKGFAILHMNISTYGDTAFPNGFVLSKTGADMNDKKPRFLEATALNKKINGDITITINKKSDGNWNYVFNGQTFILPASAIKDNIANADNCYIGFSTWSKCDMSFTVAEITDASSKTTTKPTTKTNSTTGKTTKSSSGGNGGNTTAAESSTDDTSAVASTEATGASSDVQTTGGETTNATDVVGGTSSPNLVLPIILIVVLLAGCGVGVFFLVKMKKAHKPE